MISRLGHAISIAKMGEAFNRMMKPLAKQRPIALIAAIATQFIH
jgi:hypothetical protein